MNAISINKRITLSLFIAVITGMTLLFSCTSRIDIHTDDAPVRLVIYGYITNDTMKHTIRITRSTGYFTTTKPPAVSNAMVTISSDKDTIALFESLTEPGSYQTQSNVFGVPGKTYTLNVSLDFDDDGQMEEFTASSYLPYPAVIDSIGLQASATFDDRIDILLYGKTAPNDRNYFSFHAFKNQIALTDTLVYFRIVDDEYIDKKDFYALPCYDLEQNDEDHPDQTLFPGDIVTLRINVLTKDYAQFLNDAQLEVWGSIPMFSGPPANIQTNIRSVRNSANVSISGYFSAFSGVKGSTIYHP